MAQLNHATTITLAQFTTKFRKAFGEINSVQMIKDSEYAWEIFRKVDADGDADLVLLSLNLKNQLGLFKSPPRVEAPETVEAEASKSKYKFGARG